MRTAPYAGATRGRAVPRAHAARARIGGGPGPASSVGAAVGSAAAEPSTRRASASLCAPTPPLTSTRCTRAPASADVARTCSALAPPVHTGAPISRAQDGPAAALSAEAQQDVALTHSLQPPP